VTVLYLSDTELQRSASAATTTFSHTAPSGQRGILIGFARGLTSGAVSLVSYGGTNLVQVARATDTATEPGAAEWWFAPHTTTGAQTVSYNQNLPGSMVHVVAISLGGDGTPYVQGSRTVSENTTSLSVSLTTGYVSGMAFGSLYWGGAAPSDVTLGAGQSLVHDWDMGAYGSKITRLTDVTTAGTGPAISYYHTVAGDDIAWAVVFITDGVIPAGSPQASVPTIAGLIPTLSLTLPLVEATALPGVGAFSVDGQIPTVEQQTTVEATASPGVGLVAINSTGQAGPILESGPGTLNQHAPDLYSELLIAPDVGAFTIDGKQPELLTEITAVPDVGAFSFAGQAPELITDTVLSPNVGAFSASGLTPTLSVTLPASAETTLLIPGVGLVSGSTTLLIPGAGIVELPTGGETIPSILPITGAVSVSGQVPTLYLERLVEVGLGAVSIDGRIPSVQTETAVEATALPGVGAVSIEGREPSAHLERIITPDAAASSVQGRSPAALGEDQISPSQGQVSISGRQASLQTERIITPTSGAFTVQGRQVSLPLENGIAPSVGAFTIGGLAPDLWTERVIEPAGAMLSQSGYIPTLTKTFPAGRDPPRTFERVGFLQRTRSHACTRSCAGTPGWIRRPRRADSYPGSNPCRGDHPRSRREETQGMDSKVRGEPHRNCDCFDRNCVDTRADCLLRSPCR
jgi:hypothetical protein